MQELTTHYPGSFTGGTIYAPHPPDDSTRNPPDDSSYFGLLTCQEQCEFTTARETKKPDVASINS